MPGVPEVSRDRSPVVPRHLGIEANRYEGNDARVNTAGDKRVIKSRYVEIIRNVELKIKNGLS